MNTFLPFKCFRASAACLDSKRLRNQLNECKVIRAALAGAKPWARHPATLMWAGYEDALQGYMSCLADEMWSRRIPVPAWAPELSGLCEMPPWLGHPAFHEHHRRNLLRKDYKHYRPWFNDAAGSDVYAWPTRLPGGIWVIRFKQVGAKQYQDRTEPINQPTAALQHRNEHA